MRRDMGLKGSGCGQISLDTRMVSLVRGSFFYIVDPKVEMCITREMEIRKYIIGLITRHYGI